MSIYIHAPEIQIPKHQTVGKYAKSKLNLKNKFFYKNGIDSDDAWRCFSKRPRVYRIIFLFSSLSSNDAGEELEKRHDLALEDLTKARDERLKYIDYMNDRLKKEANAKKTFTDINEVMNEYYIITGSRFDLPSSLRKEPKLADFYVPS